MNTIDRGQLIESILKQRRTPQQGSVAAKNLPAVITPEQTTRRAPAPDIRASETVFEGLAAAQPKLMSESLDTLERGFRRSQLYRQSDGRNFIRNEEVLLTERGMKRTVSQENPSGSQVTFEENLERQADGSFRRTVRYTNETGAVETKIETGRSGINPFIASGGTRQTAPSPFESTRGQTLNIVI